MEENIQNTAPGIDPIPEGKDLVTVYAHLVKDEDGDFRVLNLSDNKLGRKLTFIEEGRTIALTVNDANRKYYSKTKAEAAFAAGATFIPLTYKQGKHFGAGIKHLPGENLIKYLPEAEQAEYRAIMERAIAARAADKAPALTDKEKLERQLKKLQEKLASLESGDTTDATDTPVDGGKKSKKH